MDKALLLWLAVAALVVIFTVYFQRWMKPEHKRERAVKLLASAYADEERERIYDKKLAEYRKEHGVDGPVCRPDSFVEAEDPAR